MEGEFDNLLENLLSYVLCGVIYISAAFLLVNVAWSISGIRNFFGYGVSLTANGNLNLAVF